MSQTSSVLLSQLSLSFFFLSFVYSSTFLLFILPSIFYFVRHSFPFPYTFYAFSFFVLLLSYLHFFLISFNLSSWRSSFCRYHCFLFFAVVLVFFMPSCLLMCLISFVNWAIAKTKQFLQLIFICTMVEFHCTSVKVNLFLQQNFSQNKNEH